MTLDKDVAISIIRTSNEAIVVVDSNGDIVLANDAANALFGYHPDELQGKPIEVLMPEAMRHSHEEHRRRYNTAPRSRPLVAGLNLKGQTKDGSVFDAEIALSPIESDDGILVSSTIRDVTKDDTSEAQFRNILESAPDAMVIIDERGRIAVVNGRAETMFGYNRVDMLGQSIEILLPEQLRSRHIQHRDGYLSDPVLRPMGTNLELRGRRADASEFPVEISLNAVRTANGMFVSSVIRDVTNRKEMEQELISARHDAERANKANTAFLAAASHDLRQPVQALSLLNGALRRTVKESLALEMVDSQQASLDAMTNLLNSLLDISRLDAGKIQPERESFPVQSLIDRLFAEFSRQSKQKGLRFEADECDVTTESDPSLLSEILQNFVSNAIRYTETGTIRLSCRHDSDGSFWVDVTDTGVGIEGKHLEEIFEEFHQIKVPGKDKEGFGLGLAIVRRLADLLGHKISVQSSPGVGSTFSIQLPVMDSIDAQEPIESAAPVSEDVRGSGQIILVEDDVNVAHAWALLLKAEGYQVLAAKSVDETREVVQGLTTTPDLIISDYHLLDGSTGMQAIAMLREMYNAIIPAFIVTGDTSKLVQQARLTRNCIIMNKPVDTDHLLEVATQAIKTGLVPTS